MNLTYKSQNLLLVFSCLLFGIITTQQVFSQNKKAVFFDWFEYQGNDSVFERNKPTFNQYQNPVLAGFYPDPSICRVGNDYYLVNSSFSFFPGVPIFHSTDLVHWKQIGHVFNRPSQLKFDGLAISSGIYAPTLRYYKGLFYLITTEVYGRGNFYVTAKLAEGPWSDPVVLPEVDGIDPSFFFDDNGKAYVANNGAPKDNKELYSGHRGIWMQEFSIEQGKMVGPRKLIVDGGVDILKKPIWIEGPHILKKDNYYYLVAAEGGTGTNHSEVVFRSDSVWGPYVPSFINPILTQRNLDPTRLNPVTCTGHADLFETQKGEWWAVFLGCRPYKGGLFNTGRETFMLPVEWKEGWPIITKGSELVPYIHQKPDLPLSTESVLPMSGNFTSRDDFNDTTLAFNWNFIRVPHNKWYSLMASPGYLKIDMQPISIKEVANPSFIGRRQQHSNFTVSTCLILNGIDSTGTAGLVAFQHEKQYLFLGIKKLNNKLNVFVESRAGNIQNGVAQKIADFNFFSKSISCVYLKMEGKAGICNFYASLDNDKWTLVKSDVDATILSTEKAGGFVGTYLGMYASSKHE